MASQTIIDASNQSRPRVSLFAREAFVLVLTLACGCALVAMLIFAPRVFLARAPLAGVGYRQSIGLAQLQDYASAVRDYLAGLLRGSLGVNGRGAPVSRDLLPAARRTLELLGVSVATALPLGLVWGGLLASARGRIARTLLFGLNTLVNSLPSFVVMMLAIEFISSLTLRTGFRLTYVQGYGLDRHLILPTSVLALRGAAYMARSIQVAQEQILRQDWIRAARARGLGGLALWRRHVLPALRLPLIGSALGMIRVIVTGLVIVDYMYNWNGLGSYMLKATGSLGARNPNDQLLAGAGVLLVCLFVGIDALGRLLLRQADPRLRGGIGE
jgi:ABC-type dipeptide/oligopeptide/nickel transport system permease component